ncbi:MAG: hypothetical protein U0903_12540 [Planctomycetales bacterium]
MTGSAHVQSIDSVVRFNNALKKFQDEASRSLVMIDEQAIGALEWIEREAPAYWRDQVRRCFNEVARARAALDTAKMKGVAGSRPACIEEQNNLRKAQERLRHAHEMLEVVRKWAQRVSRAIDDYRGRIMAFRYTVDSDLPRTIAMLGRSADALHQYAERQKEPDEEHPAPSETSPTTSATPTEQ